MTSRGEVEPNLARAADLLHEAASRGAQLAVLPENFALMGANETDKLARGRSRRRGPDPGFSGPAAARIRPVDRRRHPPDRQRRAGPRLSACCVYDDNGARVARYDKIHLFDVGLPDSARGLSRIRDFHGGRTAPVVIDSPFGMLGLSICYDLRFPELYRALSAAGAEIMVAPSAFTHTTGHAPLARPDPGPRDREPGHH